jgi:hypothetical protein
MLLPLSQSKIEARCEHSKPLGETAQTQYQLSISLAPVVVCLPNSAKDENRHNLFPKDLGLAPKNGPQIVIRPLPVLTLLQPCGLAPIALVKLKLICMADQNTLARKPSTYEYVLKLARSPPVLKIKARRGEQNTRVHS